MKKLSNAVSVLSVLSVLICIFAWANFLRTYTGNTAGINLALAYSICIGICSVFWVLELLNVIRININDGCLIKRSTLALLFDTQCIFSAIVLIIKHYIVIDSVDSLMMMNFISDALLLVAMLLERTGRVKGTSASAGASLFAKLLLLGIVVLVGLLGTFIMTLAKVGIEGIADFMVYLLQQGVVIAKKICLILYGVLEYINSIATKLLGGIPDTEGMGFDTYTPQFDMDAFQEDPDPRGLYVIAAIFAIIVICGVVLVIREFITRNRNAKIRKQPVRLKKQNNFKSQLARLADEIRAEIYYRYKLIVMRNTPPAKLIRIERSSVGKLRRQKSESGESYLRRLGYNELAQELEKYFYAANDKNSLM